jgi:hypothetical protein
VWVLEDGWELDIELGHCEMMDSLVWLDALVRLCWMSELT